ncbi:KPN_02809 family neutral zinc metallopeptidase [Microbacterium resistens]|uniref:Neutral zinc metallopeptidase n=1 Tax=Microbacterium resistens TaxID=156977 RepID=A0ABY3RQY6_9MICO|nr:neutral zinc metallopeptidase [Microbacterium resistens]MBW1638784.1 neutral zinc metallopeptidase [Microbacterium resistens]UGS25279.1 neutral zinc metallopeptidase [Microbacterium resistens]
MTFNPDADISGNTTRRRGRTAAIAGGGVVGVGALAVMLISMFTGVDLSGLLGGGAGAPAGGTAPSSSEGALLDECNTGQDANTNDDCRMAGAQVVLDDYWTAKLDGYRPPQMTVVDGQTATQCGTASNAVGPFYCPPEEGVYLDPTFFQLMRQQFGASAGELAQLYIVGHEWGHHIQNITGVMSEHPNNGTGPYSNGVRIELQADCYAGAWLGAITQQTDENGVPFLEKPTDAQINDALNAAFTVGDDHIQEQSGFSNPESWTHGSSAQRQGWFAQGYKNAAGDVFAVCDTFAVPDANL